MDENFIKKVFYDVFCSSVFDYQLISIEKQESFSNADKFLVVVRLSSSPLESLFKLYRLLGSKSHVFIRCGVGGTFVFTIYFDN